jgi:rod shape-determining protein MreD
MDNSAWFTPARLTRCTFLAMLGLAAIFVEAAPLGLRPDAYPSPDILFCFIAYWSIRRPRSAPLLLVWFLGLARDLLTDLPVGAGALGLVLASEFLKSLGSGLSRRSFVTEWLLIATLLLLLLAGQWLIVVILFVHPPYLLDLAHHWVVTVALYPVLALILRWLFRIGWRRMEPE